MRGFWLLLLAVCLPACEFGGRKDFLPAHGAGPAPVPETEISWTRDVWPILIVRCQICHTSGTGALQVPDMKMTDASTLYNEWVRVLSQCNPNLFRVLPGRRDLSFVFNKINELAPLCGAQMPLQDAPLDDADQQTIGVWIDQGAPQN